jgi:uncharacterized membrane protein YkoI
MDRFRFLILAAALAAAVPAWADVGRDEAATIAQRAVQGRVLAVERGIDASNRPVWRVKVLTANGELRVVLVDLATGRPQ